MRFKFLPTKLEGTFIVEPPIRRDERGLFSRVWCKEQFGEFGLESDFVQSNQSLSLKAGTLRGLHYQVAPYDEAKLIRCIHGSLFDVVIDVRPDSSTYLQWMGTILTADSYRMLYMPPGLAHGFQTLENDTQIMYMVDKLYKPEAERGIRWDDPTFNIEWPEPGAPILSEKDLQWPDFSPGSPLISDEKVTDYAWHGKDE